MLETGAPASLAILRPGRLHIVVRAAILVVLLSISLGLCPAWAAATPKPLWQEPGIMYYQDVNPRLPLVVHVVRIDRAQKDLEFHTTLGGHDQLGMAVLSEQATYIDPKVGKPVAAINGDYFFIERPFFGDPMNLHIFRGGEIVSAPGLDRAFFYLDAKDQPHITNAVPAFTVTWPNGKVTPMGLNEMPESFDPVLYTSAAGRMTRVEAIDLILERTSDLWLPLRVGQTLTAKVKKINKQGFSRIDRDCMVMSVHPALANKLPALTTGMVVKISMATKPDLTGAQLAIGGGPTLVRSGKAREAHEFSGFQRRDPRSAMGWNDQYYYFVQADGRQPRYSMGMSLEELAQFFVKLGCTDALNLDGGGSCTTWIAGRTVNSPSQHGMERPSANALVLVRKSAK